MIATRVFICCILLGLLLTCNGWRRGALWKCGSRLIAADHYQRGCSYRCWQHQSPPSDHDLHNLSEHGQSTPKDYGCVEQPQHEASLSVELPHAVNESSPDPLQAEINAQEEILKQDLAMLEDKLRSRRVQLVKLKERMSESGKNGYFLVQAQVNDFLRRKDSEQKLRVAQNKKDFVDKMLPIVEMFRSVPRTYPPSTEREVNMHNTYAALLESIVAVIDKYGYAHLLEELNKKDRNLAHNVEPMEHELPAPSTSSQHNSSVT